MVRLYSPSRKAYSEVVWQQTTESFIRCLENAFRHFGGVPKTLVIDNLRAAVTRAKRGRFFTLNTFWYRVGAWLAKYAWNMKERFTM